MIFPEHRTIFFHVPRTGGTSVERLLAGGALDARVTDRERLWGWDPQEHFNLHHATVETTLRLIGRERFAAYYKLAVVRDPFSRLVSVYSFNFRHYHEKYVDFRGFVRALPKIVQTKHCRLGHHETPQHCFTHEGGVQAVDTVLRFEDLPGCMDEVRARLGIAAPLPNVNKSRYPELTSVPVAAHYDAEGVDIMRQVYAQDFARFGYPDTPTSQPRPV